MARSLFTRDPECATLRSVMRGELRGLSYHCGALRTNVTELEITVKLLECHSAGILNVNSCTDRTEILLFRVCGFFYCDILKFLFGLKGDSSNFPFSFFVPFQVTADAFSLLKAVSKTITHGLCPGNVPLFCYCYLFCWETKILLFHSSLILCNFIC